MSSKNPTDKLTPDMGSSWLMPNFDFDAPSGQGVLDGARLPEVHGLAGLPDGVVTSEATFMDVPDGVVQAEEEGMDLGEMGLFASEEGENQPTDDYMEDLAKVEEIENVVDHTWLSEATQDPARLPNDPFNRTIPELVDAWGSRTTGVDRIEAVDLEDARHQASEEESKPKYTDDQVRDVLARAMRRSASGWDLDRIKAEIVDSLGHEAVRLARSVKALEAEHGLHGNVYLRASAFPGLLRGKWAKTIRKKFKGVKYLIACGNCDACKSGCSGNCACNKNLGMESVASVPWKKAYAHYAPRLELSGRLDRTASVKDKRAALQQAFLTRGKSTAPKVAQQFPTHKAPAQRVSSKEAFEQLASEEIVQEKISGEYLHLARRRKKAFQRIARWHKRRLLSADQVRELIAAEDSPEALVKKAARMVAAAKETVEYTGSGYGQMPKMASTEEAVEALQDETALKRAAQEAAHEKKIAGENAKQVKRLMRYARQQMTEGFVAKDLNDLLKGRFSETLLKGANEQLVQIRKSHEGLSGHLYVDAEAYATPTGTKGCDKGALRHRASAVPTVLAMSRCGSCVHKNADGYCSKYNKPLVDSAPVEDPIAYQKEQIRLATSSDAEVTASYFNPVSEFGLQNENLDDINVSDVPETDRIADFAFGGLELGDE
jgi:hypothetical protein